MSEDVRAIDCVVNIWTPEALEHRPLWRESFFVGKIGTDAALMAGLTLPELIDRMDEAGIERAFLVAVRAGPEYHPTSARVPYQIVADAVARHPDRFYGLAGVDPTEGMAGERELEHAVTELGFVGAHFYPHWFEMAPDHARMYPFYAKCVELGVPIQMQVGQSLIYAPDRPLRSTGRPITLDGIACDFPELVLIGIHVGIPWASEMIAMAWKHPNVYIGSDAHSPRYWPPEFVQYINSYGQDKVLFGTDFPVLDFGRTMREIDELGLRPASKRKFLRDNVARVYGLEL